MLHAWSRTSPVSTAELDATLLLVGRLGIRPEQLVALAAAPPPRPSRRSGTT